jgi:hypothetical protein
MSSSRTDQRQPARKQSSLAFGSAAQHGQI